MKLAFLFFLSFSGYLFIFSSQDENADSVGSPKIRDGCNCTAPCLNYYTYWNGYCYRGYMTNFYSADSADLKCMNDTISIGSIGHLVSIHSEFENAYLTGIIDNYSNDYLIGIHYAGGKWVAYDGTNFDFNKWDNGQPVDPDNLNCTKAMMIDGDFSYKWVTTACDDSTTYICKYPARYY
ncbi:hypothetical protein WR25_12683 [Diploscapter pachys]|uniref:C-type lectin domain-containing protein n=1 Tax=Diploscapter pachys TaxID=2018661 RepID=A0A2A2K2W3_9BILA|nr:hypothetical protein WR25_12683 [Diploscapter pachys]